MKDESNAPEVDLYCAMKLTLDQAIDEAVESIPDAELQKQIEGVLKPLFNIN